MNDSTGIVMTLEQYVHGYGLCVRDGEIIFAGFCNMCLCVCVFPWRCMFPCVPLSVYVHMLTCVMWVCMKLPFPVIPHCVAPAPFIHSVLARLRGRVKECTGSVSICLYSRKQRTLLPTIYLYPSCNLVPFCPLCVLQYL